MSANINRASGAADLFRLRTAANGAIIKAVVLTNGNLQLRSDFGSTTINSNVAIGTGWHNVELCGTVGSNTTWDLFRDGTEIVTDWVANTGTTPVGRIQIGDTAAKTFTINWDHVVFDTAPGDSATGDLTPPGAPGTPTGNSPTAGVIQIGWTAATDPAPASLPITYRVFEVVGGNNVQLGTTTQTSFTHIGPHVGHAAHLPHPGGGCRDQRRPDQRHFGIDYGVLGGLDRPAARSRPHADRERCPPDRHAARHDR